uniref:Zona pellucida sperm-binding protein 4 n=1 Tax=Labrus bergylta TaxID=56723 RepID=A0A3Q3NJE8_9LABR
MAKHWSATSFVALALLGYLVGTEVDAQVLPWLKKGFQPPRDPQNPQFPPAPPSPPQTPQNPQFPPAPPSPPQTPQNPQFPPAPPSPPKTPQYPKVQPAALPINNYHGSYDRYDQTPQDPQFPQPQNPVPQIPVIQSCDVEERLRIPCGASDCSADHCETINCCFDGQKCYFGKAVTVQCTKDAQFIVVVARDATLPNIDLESISLLGEGQFCTYVGSNSGFAIYQFPITACGSVVMEEPGVIIYENRMSSSFEVGVGPLGAITRDSRYELLFQCRYTATSVETLVVQVLPLDNPVLSVAAFGPIRVHLRLANGQCNSKGCYEADVAYSSYYTEADYPVSKVLRNPVYVEVQLLEKTDPNLVLTLGRCWTTTSPNPHSLPQWDILIDGSFQICLVGFIFKMFTFVNQQSVDPLREQVYIHCSTTVCSSTQGNSCERCASEKRDVKAVDQETAGPKVVVSAGPVSFSRAVQ